MYISDEDPPGAFAAAGDMYVEETALGHGDPPIKVTVGQVRFGQLQAERLVPRLPFGNDARPDLGEYALYLVRAPHTVEFGPSERRLLWLEVRYTLYGGSLAYDLAPSDVRQTPERPLIYGIGTDLRFITLGEGLPGTPHEIRFTRLTPEITALGAGTPEFAWRYDGSGGTGVRPGDRLACAILRVPTGTTRVAVQARADFEQKGLVAAFRRRGRVDPEELDLKLPA
ncbi:hypothetical protein [Rhizohabitans arisaemae]|uniref:hypothetical protein n=1 Tax=Rhizohabitans arisaemae TaxID=2720610 RepID=UPI0024B1C608|nr:hypothetical protein [Rhizohabitans arisaemae]